ncbi:hypothetical protein G5I_09535 [Acromyrmex echinatior]|uniref:Uncharacterized protein n=1 Tax=Acromyrmex echinatior TaxID=103372 RepID=F4WUG5_ACREC|nr:hypothetical protein G5I_09535 [Acromyrmex echinatior]
MDLKKRKCLHIFQRTILKHITDDITNGPIKYHNMLALRLRGSRVELMQADTAIGAPSDFKVNTPLKSHQSKIESLTVARELFYIQSNNGHGHYARCVHTPYVNKDGNMTKISRIAVTGVARAGEGVRGSAGAQVGSEHELPHAVLAMPTRVLERTKKGVIQSQTRRRKRKVRRRMVLNEIFVSLVTLAYYANLSVNARKIHKTILRGPELFERRNGGHLQEY